MISKVLQISIVFVYIVTCSYLATKYIFFKCADILASEHEEAIFAASDALNSMINYCIDESLIKQGVDQITLNESRRSGPTIIEKICATVESLLGYHYAAAWDRVFEVVSTMFYKLGILIAVKFCFCF
jgi:ribosomal RNA-processing protein 12